MVDQIIDEIMAKGYKISEAWKNSEEYKNYKMSESTKEILKELDDRIEKIWFEPPSEIENLKKPRGPHCQSFTMVNYAFHRLYNLAGTLGTIRSMAITHELHGPEVRVLTKKFIERDTVVESLGLTDTAELLRKTANAVGVVMWLVDYCAIVERLIIYLCKMSGAGWLDNMMAWEKLGYIYEMIKE